MEWIKGFVQGIKDRLVGAPEGASPKSLAPADIKTISDAVYLLREPSEGKPEIEIVFIHGLQLSAYNDAYWETWTTVDEKGEKICWPMTWLAEEIPQARILALSYDSSALRTRTQGRTDSYLVGESLLAEMVDFGDIGQSGCPLLFVCHSLGGIVIKEIVKMAAFQRRDNEKIQKFLKSIIGFHFYATPHDGSKLAGLASYVPLLKQGPFVKTLEVINDDLGRLNKDFKSIAKKDFGDKWKYSVVAEKWATTCIRGFNAMVVPEASARHEYDDHFLAVDADHFGVCKPISKVDSSFLWLTNFVFGLQTSEFRITNGQERRQEAAVLL
jgi:hypothetical protein